jgi:hypothetical protein
MRLLEVQAVVDHGGGVLANSTHPSRKGAVALRCYPPLDQERRGAHRGNFASRSSRRRWLLELHPAARLETYPTPILFQTSLSVNRPPVRWRNPTI